MTHEDAETVRRLQQDVILPQAVPNRRLEEAQGRVQAGAETQEAGLQQGQDAEWRAVIRGDEGRRPQGRARDDSELRLMSVHRAFFAMRRGEMSVGDNIEP